MLVPTALLPVHLRSVWHQPLSRVHHQIPSSMSGGKFAMRRVCQPPHKQAGGGAYARRTVRQLGIITPSNISMRCSNGFDHYAPTSILGLIFRFRSSFMTPFMRPTLNGPAQMSETPLLSGANLPPNASQLARAVTAHGMERTRQPLPWKV